MSFPPSCNTGGTSPETSPVLVDWVRFSFDEAVLEDVLDCLGVDVFGVEVPLSRTECRGLWGYRFGMVLHAEDCEVGRVFYGGEAQRGRATFEASGPQCARLNMRALATVVEVFGATLTRVDLAADFHAGEVTIADAVREYHAGGFTSERSPRAPSSRLVDDMGCGTGCTLYVGSREGSKFARVYEKGKQLGDAGSPWVRVEVELKRRDYHLSPELLRDPAAFFAGCYPIFGAWVDVATRRLAVIAKAVSAEVGHALHHARLQVGGVIAFVARRLSWPASRVVRELMRPVISAKLERHAPNAAFAEQRHDADAPPLWEVAPCAA